MAFVRLNKSNVLIIFKNIYDDAIKEHPHMMMTPFVNCNNSNLRKDMNNCIVKLYHPISNLIVPSTKGVRF